MMKIKTASSALSIMALFAAAVASSCSSDSGIDGGNGTVAGGNSGNGETKTEILTAEMSENDATTRVGMTMEEGDAVSFYWHSDDAIFVQTENNDTYSGAKFTTEAETGSTSVEFTGEVLSDYSVGSYAVYPYNADHKFTSATALTYNLPSKYDYSTVESGIFSKTDGKETTYRSTSTNMPMVGTITESSVSFNHIGGLVVIRIDQMPVESGTLTVTADQQLCGDFTIDNLEANDAAIETSTSTETTANNTVTITFSGATKDAVGVFYLPLATGSYSGLKIAIGDETTTQTVNYGNLYVARASVNAIPLYTINGTLRKWSTENEDGTYTINGQTFVDLGLSVLWATCNIGASSPEEYGNYYAWGEVTAYGESTDWGKKGVKTDFSWANYKYGNAKSNSNNLTKYCKKDKKSTLEAEDDAATRNWGSGVRMMSKNEFSELKDNSNWEWTTVDGVNGWKITSNISGYTSNSIFVPVPGYYDGTTIKFNGEKGYYWVTSLSNTVDYMYANDICFGQNYKSNVDYSNHRRSLGLSVRPVAEK